MLRAATALVLLSLFLGGCGKNIQTKEKVEEALRSHLSNNAGLDLKSLDISVTNLSFDRNTAQATVFFRPKGSTNLGDSMQMNYALEQQGDHWVVKGRSDSQGHGKGGGAPPATQGLPPGHPPVNGGGQQPSAPPPLSGDTPGRPQ